jgi:hypothetical protein
LPKFLGGFPLQVPPPHEYVGACCCANDEAKPIIKIKKAADFFMLFVLFKVKKQINNKFVKI